MPLVKAQCTNCNGTLEVDSTKDAAICPYCNQAYIIEKAIQHFQVNNHFNISNATIQVETEYEKLRKAGDYFYQHGEYDKAKEKYEKILSDYPQEDKDGTIRQRMPEINAKVQIAYVKSLTNGFRNPPQITDKEIIEDAKRTFDYNENPAHEYGCRGMGFVTTIPGMSDIEKIPRKYWTEELTEYVNEWKDFCNQQSYDMELWNTTYNKLRRAKKMAPLIEFLIGAGIFIVIFAIAVWFLMYG